MTRLSFQKLRASAPLRELAIFSAFLALSVLMTWPWALHIRDAVSDTGDPYLNAWIMWWDYHQTFQNPFSLFQAPIFYPYRDTLAFSEHGYGLALHFFPLYALGVRPLTIQGVATIFGFALSGYGAFRLTRTLTGSAGAGWIAGVAFGFSPYRFNQLSHLIYLFAGWIPLLFEALVIFARRRSWPRAAWLGAAFLMNALTCVHWFMFSLIPFALACAFLLTRRSLWRERAFWVRGGLCLLMAGLFLLPFLLPYKRVADRYGMLRSREETQRFSATVGNWLSAESRNYLWRGFGPLPEWGERALFPGLLPLLLLVAAFYFARRDAEESPTLDERRRRLTAWLDVSAFALLVIAFLAYGYDSGIRLFGLKFLHTNEYVPLTLFVVVLIARLSIKYPRRFLPERDRNLVETIRKARRGEAFGIGLILALTGFLGSLGLNSFFHRFLFEHVFLFRGTRAPVRWGMIGHLGIAVLAGLGALLLARALSRMRPKRLSANWVYAALCVFLLFELRAAPLRLERGEVEPDALTLHLKETEMRGGIVHLPSGGVPGNYRYMLRQTDHHRPLVTAVSGFLTPHIIELESLTRQQPVPERLLDLLEEIPASYLAVHSAQITPDARAALDVLLTRGIAEGRLRFIGSFPGTGLHGNEGAELYAVVKTEPEARAEGPAPARLAPRVLGESVEGETLLLLSAFEDWSYPLYRIRKVAYGRMPRFQEIVSDARETGEDVTLYSKNWESVLQANIRALAERLAESRAFQETYAGLSDERFIARLYENAGVSPDESERAALVNALRDGRETRASALLKVASNETFINNERKRALVLMHYFGYLRRNPDDAPDSNLDGFNFWIAELEKHGRERLAQAFALAGEYRDKAAGEGGKQ